MCLSDFESEKLCLKKSQSFLSFYLTILVSIIKQKNTKKSLLHLAIVFFLATLAFFIGFVLLIVNLRLLCSALLMAEKRRMLRMTREMQGRSWTKRQRNHQKVMK